MDQVEHYKFFFIIIEYNLVETGTYFVESFIKDLAKLFSSTKANGKIPIRSSNFPSAQFSSTLLMTEMTSPLLNVKQPSSSSLVIRKS